MGDRTGVEIISTCPQSSDLAPADYARRVAEVARWSEAFGCTGILVYTDNRLADPWLVAQLVVQATQSLRPLVAVQPVYMHPYSVAKMVASMGHLHGREVMLNLVAGGFKNDLDALGDGTPHDERYGRLVEYAYLILRLFQGAPVTYEGTYYRVAGLRLSPRAEGVAGPRMFVSGSSEAGLGAAVALGATAVMYPKPPAMDPGAPKEVARAAVRVGIVARATDEEAWEVAHARFPPNRRGEIEHELARKTSDSVWHHALSALAVRPGASAGAYWLHPFHSYRTFCPYLVGSHATVGAALEQYLALGYRTFLLDIPASEEELSHTSVAFEKALGERRC
ncbi:MAG: LLM class flavin-dependent oxidoreductase [Polyangiaceae bacterium]